MTGTEKGATFHRPTTFMGKGIVLSAIRKIFCTLLACTLALATQAHAGLVDDAESPVTTDAKWILLTGTGLTLAVIATEDSLSGPWETSTANRQPLGKYSKYGDML